MTRTSAGGTAVNATLTKRALHLLVDGVVGFVVRFQSRRMRSRALSVRDDDCLSVNLSAVQILESLRRCGVRVRVDGRMENAWTYHRSIVLADEFDESEALGPPARVVLDDVGVLDLTYRTRTNRISVRMQ